MQLKFHSNHYIYLNFGLFVKHKTCLKCMRLKIHLEVNLKKNK